MKLLLLVLLSFATAFAQNKATGNVDNGKKLFTRNGCFQCHGTQGQGGAAGARLNGTKLTLPVFTAILRNPPPSNMPPYRAKVMTDQEVADVYAYIQTFPPPPPLASVPLLKE